MRQYRPLTKPDGRVARSQADHVNPYYGQRGADWIKNTNASLFNAQHEPTQTKTRFEQRVSRATRNVLLGSLATVGMLIGGFIVYALAINW
ncbi:hypothetical protein [Lactiplantibacillus modestisalitolerans]|uniref:Uncharacterized protein n=1 Tax=Lactiplantibacillus modestisalitolerans TaxID=1457219 RepID=A0ABV5WXM1_9LACO|nr:hypothetical protein [Lactiplantibacillus modestisalitolerans]